MNKWFISATIIIALGSICGATTYKVIKNHNEKISLVESKYIIEQAKKCINGKKCNKENNITLKELYDLDYLTKQVNKVTKEYYNELSYVTYKNNEYTFIIK